MLISHLSCPGLIVKKGKLNPPYAYDVHKRTADTYPPALPTNALGLQQHSQESRSRGSRG